MKTPINSVRYPHLYSAAASEFRSFKTRLFARFSEERQGDPQKLKIIFATLAKRNFPGIRPGRPQDEKITLACALRAKRRHWSEVYKACGVATIEDQTRLYDAVRKRHKAIRMRTRRL
jgi:hypothetical protein